MNATAVAPGTLSHRQVLVVFSGLLMALLLAALDSTIVATALPTIVGELGGLERLGWVVTAYLLAQTMVTPLYGKLGDLYGRKIVLQTAIVIFLLGSALCGLSQTMMQLVLFRFVQGLGGGGLIVTTQAVVGDIVTPRERGRYQGIFGAVFGLASIVGPLVGGYFTTEWTWRWIFYINLPLGAIALFVIAATLPRRGPRGQRSIDYLGAGLLATALASTILLSDLGGGEFGWTSPVILGLGAAAIASLIAFIVVEQRVAEPVLPLRLFRNRTFAAAAAVGAVVGLGLFGSVTYIPLFLQVVNGVSPTASGLQLLPMMAGMLTTSIAAGQLISRWGRYKIFPLVGTAVMTSGLFLLSQMDATTSVTVASFNMLVLGAGLGMVMQVLIIAVQNAVDYTDLGVATSGATLFRLMGGALGTAMFGALFASGLSRHLLAAAPAAGAGVGSLNTGRMGPQEINRLPEALHTIYISAFTASLSTVFFTAMGIAALGFFLTWLIPELPLRETVAASAADVGTSTEDIFPLPQDSTSLRELERAASLMAGPEARRAYAIDVVQRTGLQLSALAAWVLIRLDEDRADWRSAAPRMEIEEHRWTAALDELVRAGLIESDDPAAPGPLTPAGVQAVSQLERARKTQIEMAISGWDEARKNQLSERLKQPGGPV